MTGRETPVKVEVLHNRDCHIWEKSLEVVQKVLDKEGIQYELKDTLVKTREEARQKGFSGSPQVNIDGQDIDPKAPQDINNYGLDGCRLYLYEEELYEYPPEGMVLDFLDSSGNNQDQ